MISEKRSAAARANGARSRGPKTPEGKARSSRNALRHGLLAKCVLLRNENTEAFQSLFDGYVARFLPQDDAELSLVEEMVAACWHLRRAMAIETHTIDLEMDSRTSGTELDRLTAAFGDLANSPKLSLLYRYQTRLHLMHSRAIRDLMLLRRGAEAPAPATEPLDAPEIADPTPTSEPISNPAEPNEPKEPAKSLPCNKPETEPRLREGLAPDAAHPEPPPPPTEASQYH
jgi:hypothetical protein